MEPDAIGSRLVKSAQLHCDRLALWVGETEYSYGTVFGAACTLAAELDRTVGPDAPIGILGQQSFSSYVGLLAALLCGRPYVPVNPHEPYERQRAVFDIVQPAAFVCDEATFESATRHRDDMGYPAEIYIADAMSVRKLPDHIVEPTPLDGFSATCTMDSSAYILFTSGTTGLPKGVRILQRNVAAYVDAIAKFAPLHREDRSTQLIALTFDPSVHEMLTTWLAGASIWVMGPEDALDRLAFVRKHAITCWYSVPVTASNAQRFGLLRPNAAPSLRYSSFSGEALPTSVALAWQIACPNSAIFNLYGPTEATINMTYCRFDARSSMVDSPTVPIGQPNHGQFCVVVDKHGHPVPYGGEGELMLGGTQVSPGYINNPEANAKLFFEGEIGDSGVQRWYRSGDLVLNHREHGLVFKRRIDDQLKIGGYRVEMQEIEEAVRTAAGTAAVAAIPWSENGVGGADAIVAFVCGCDLPHAEVLKRCRDLLPKPLVPRKLIDLLEMPTNNSGKVDRKVLKALLGRQAASTAAPEVIKRVA